MLFGTLRKTFGSSFYNKSREPTLVVWLIGRIHFCKYGIDLCKATVGDPAFLTIQYIKFTIITEAGGGFSSQRITPAIWFSQSISPGPFSIDQFGYVLIFLFRCSKI